MDDLAETMWREHEELGHHIAELRRVLGMARLDWSRLTDLLRALSANVERHFSSEETDGYLADVLLRSSTTEREIERLRHEHGQLRRALRSIRAELEKRDAELVTRSLGEWLVAMSDHERGESALVLRVYMRDEPGPSD